MLEFLASLYEIVVAVFLKIYRFLELAPYFAKMIDFFQRVIRGVYKAFTKPLPLQMPQVEYNDLVERRKKRGT